MPTATNSTAEEKAPAASKPAGRGPSYPSMTVEEAIGKAMQFWASEKRSAAPISAAARHWGYSETSSSGKVAVAALLHYGLLEDQGSSESRTVKLTGRGLDIILDAPDSLKRQKAIQDAVRSPKIYADILAKWPDELPSDPTLRYYLLREKSFNEGAVDGFIKDLRASIIYARLDKPPIIPGDDLTKKEPKPATKADNGSGAADIGDVVQWESAGVIQFDPPRRVRAKQEHEGAWWVFVEGSETGIPMSEIRVLEKVAQGESAAKLPPTLAIPSQLVAVRGEREWLRGPLSREVGYRLLVSGDMGAKEIGKLIRLLQAQKDVLDEDDSDDPR